MATTWPVLKASISQCYYISQNALDVSIQRRVGYSSKYLNESYRSNQVEEEGKDEELE